MGLCALTGYCDQSMERAVEIAGPVAYSFFNDVLEYLYLPLAKASDDYSYFKKVAQELSDIRRDQDIDALLDHTPGILIGTPDHLIEKPYLRPTYDEPEQIEAMGYDEVVLRIDGFGHENIMSALTLFGKYIIPEFKQPVAVVRELSIPGRVA